MSTDDFRFAVGLLICLLAFLSWLSFIFVGIITDQRGELRETRSQRDYCARQWGRAEEERRRPTCDVCGGKPHCFQINDYVMTVYCQEHTPFEDDDEDGDDDLDRQDRVLKDPDAWRDE